MQTRERGPSIHRGSQPSGSGASGQGRGRGTPAFRLSVPRGSHRGGGLTALNPVRGGRDSSLPLTLVRGGSLSLSRGREGRGRSLASRGHSASRGGAGRVLPGAFVSFAIDRLKQQPSVPVPTTKRLTHSRSKVLPDGSQNRQDFNVIPMDFNSFMPDHAVQIASNSIANNTKKNYKHIFNRFISYGESLGHNVLNFNFSAVFLVGFFLSLYTSRGSIGSILMARAAINFFWVLHSNSQICPTDSPFVV